MDIIKIFTLFSKTCSLSFLIDQYSLFRIVALKKCDRTEPLLTLGNGLEDLKNTKSMM